MSKVTRALALVVCSVLLTQLTIGNQAALGQQEQAGSALAQEVSATNPSGGGSLALESIEAFDPTGGEAIFEPGTESEEPFTYSGVNGSTNHLTGVERGAAAASHPLGSFVAVVTEPTPSPSPSASGSTSPSESQEGEQPTEGDPPSTNEDDSESSPDSTNPSSEGPSSTSMDFCVGPISDPEGGLSIDQICSGELGDLIDGVVGEVVEAIGRACGGDIGTCGDKVVTLLQGVIDEVIGEIGIACDGSIDNCDDKVLALVQAVVDSAIGYIDVNCDGSIDNCDDKIVALVVGLANSVCSSAGSLGSAPGSDCKAVSEALINKIIDTACPEGLTACPTERIQDVVETLDGICALVGSFGMGGWDCKSLSESVVNKIIDTACPEGLNACPTERVKDVAEILDGVCALVGSLNGLGVSGWDCKSLSEALVNKVVDTLCPDGVTTCPQDRLDQLIETIDGACSSVGLAVSVVGSTCIEVATALVNRVIGELCPEGLSACPIERVDDIVRLLDQTCQGFCASADGLAPGIPSTSTCDELIEEFISQVPCVGSPLACIPPPPGGIPGGAPPLYCQAGVPSEAGTAMDGIPVGSPGGSAYCTDQGELVIPPDVPETFDASIGGWLDAGSQGVGVPAATAPDASPSDLPSIPSPDGLDQNDSFVPIDDDTRTRVSNTRQYPYSAVVMLRGPASTPCSGFLIGFNTVATAGHCLYDPDEGWDGDPIVYPARDGNTVPFTCTVRHRIVSFWWYQDGDSRFDWGAMKVSCKNAAGNTVNLIESRTGGFAIAHSSTCWKGRVALSGYPSSGTDESPPGMNEPFTQWRGDGPIEGCDEVFLYHEADSSGGQSGGPLYARLSSCDCIASLAIHKGKAGQSFFGDQENRGMRINADLFRVLYHYKRSRN